MLRFRLLNLLAGLMLVVFNALVGVWPMVAMNLATSAINVWFIRRLLLDRHDGSVFRVLAVKSDDAYLAYVLQVHRADALRYQPDFDWDGVPSDDRHPFLILKGDETVGVVIIRVDGDVAHVELDYVTKRFATSRRASSSGGRAACSATWASTRSSRRRSRSTRLRPRWLPPRRDVVRPGGVMRVATDNLTMTAPEATEHSRSAGNGPSVLNLIRFVIPTIIVVGVFALLTNHAKDRSATPTPTSTSASAMSSSPATGRSQIRAA